MKTPSGGGGHQPKFSLSDPGGLKVAVMGVFPSLELADVAQGEFPAPASQAQQALRQAVLDGTWTPEQPHSCSPNQEPWHLLSAHKPKDRQLGETRTSCLAGAELQLSANLPAAVRQVQLLLWEGWGAGSIERI